MERRDFEAELRLKALLDEGPLADDGFRRPAAARGRIVDYIHVLKDPRPGKQALCQHDRSSQTTWSRLILHRRALPAMATDPRGKILIRFRQSEKRLLSRSSSEKMAMA